MVVVWTVENDTKTISVDANLFVVFVWKRISVDGALAFRHTFCARLVLEQKTSDN